MIMKVNIEEKDDTISVSVSVRQYHRRRHNVKVRVLHKDVMRYLSEQKIKVGKCLQRPSSVTNRGDNPQLSAEWIFEKPKPEKAASTRKPKKAASTRKPKKAASTRKKMKKVKKTLDKSAERVIIEVQEKTLRRTEE